jgi:hypothetical protein
MGAFNRNVITDADVATLNSATTPAEVPKSLDVQPPAAATPPPGGVVVPTADDFLTKLVKYVPLEILGVYLFVEGAVESNVTEPGPLATWLGAVLVATLVIMIPYDIRVLNVVRPVQIAMSMVGMAVYVFAVGGWFATTTWYEAWYSSIVLPVFVLLVAIIRLKPLPPKGP